jgi:hypothetical protein
MLVTFRFLLQVSFVIPHWGVAPAADRCEQRIYYTQARHATAVFVKTVPQSFNWYTIESVWAICPAVLVVLPVQADRWRSCTVLMGFVVDELVLEECSGLSL